MSLQSNKIHRFGTFTADPGARTLLTGDAVVALAPKTFDLLCILLESGGRIVTKEDLMTGLWPGVFVEEANVAFQISTLRKALGERGAEWIVTVPKHGYRFVAEVIVEAEP
ncbi:MAG: transcriptional regulator, partial [Acidobacteria bacterium]|nr:transcriptional regulator [Acidobacteriota bacterium]